MLSDVTDRLEKEAREIKIKETFLKLFPEAYHDRITEDQLTLKLGELQDRIEELEKEL